MSSRIDKYGLTHGGILNKLLFIAIPIMGTQLFQMAYNLTDMFWIGRIDSESVAASGTVGMYLWLSMAFLMFGRMGAEIGVSQNKGRGDMKGAQKYAETACTLAAVLGIFYMLILIFAKRPLIGFFNISDQRVVADAEQYLFTVALGVPFSFVTSSLVGCYNGFGNTRLPFLVNALGLVINMVLDPVLIFGAGLGIVGAGIATVIAQGVVCSLMIFSVVKSKNRPFLKFRLFAVPQMSPLLQILKWGAPIALESLLFTFLSMIISRFVASWGAGAMAVQKVGSQIESLSWLICGGFSSALTAFIGQNFGAGKWTRIHRGYKISVSAMLVWGCIVTLVMFFGSEVLVSVFLHEPEYIELGGQYLRILATCQVLACLEYTTAGCFRGMGKTLPASVVSASCNLMRVIAAYYLSQTHLGLSGIYWAITIGAAARGVWLFTWYVISRKKMPSTDINAAV